MINEPKFGITTEQYDISFPQYYDVLHEYGYFSKDGRIYTVTDKNTPRQWYSVMVNKNFASIVTNDGFGLLGYKSFCQRFTKFYSLTDYMIRQLNGERRIYLKSDDGSTYDLIKDSEDLKFSVMPGSCKFSGTINSIHFEIQIFVPNEDPVECTKVTISDLPSGNWTLMTKQDWGVYCTLTPNANHTMDAEVSSDRILLKAANVHTFGDLIGFTAHSGLTATVEPYTEATDADGVKIQHYYRVTTEKRLSGNTEDVYIYSGVCSIHETSIINRFLSVGYWENEFSALNRKWDDIITRNNCELPDKNFQYFLNIWLKNQLHVTSLYNRFGRMGYRDILQDCWGALYHDMDLTARHILEAASRMYPDGRCPRQFDLYSDVFDIRDFADSPIWMPIALSYYLKETGNFDILQQKIPYYKSDEITDLAEHIDRALDYMYHSRGNNRLILLRNGDWLDGLEGLNKHGEATGVWLTIAAFHAQNLMAEIYRQINCKQKATKLEQRSAEYKEIVNTVGWNGKWYSYAIINDTEIIGGPDSVEGKIYLNPQTWAIFTGIAETDKYEKIMRAINVYLTTPVGPLLMAPPYVTTGHRYGRLHKQRPGTFANSAVYLHAASFKVFADVARGDYNEAYDTFCRIIPNNIDNPASRRTSEPWAVGNVHYGTAHQCTGLNLYSWFSATPAWLIHGGFEEILGVKPEFNGLRITAADIDGWDTYSVERTYRNTKYKITFNRTGNNRIVVDGNLITGNIVQSDKPVCIVDVEF